MKTLIISFALVLAPSLAFADKDFDDGKGAKWDCKDDPIVNINHGSGTYTFVGACTLGRSTDTPSVCTIVGITVSDRVAELVVIRASEMLTSAARATARSARNGRRAWRRIG